MNKNEKIQLLKGIQSGKIKIAKLSNYKIIVYDNLDMDFLIDGVKVTQEKFESMYKGDINRVIDWSRVSDQQLNHLIELQRLHKLKNNEQKTAC